MNVTDLLASTGANRYKKVRRVGRGRSSGRGKTCGRGTKGQGARAGKLGRPQFEGGQTSLILRTPKRGFNNKWKKCYAAVNLSQLDAKFKDGDTVTPEVLLERRILRKLQDGVKVLGKGELSKRLTVRAHRFSASAKDKITKAGGQVLEIS